MLTVLNSIVPVFALIALGTVLKKLRVTSDEFLKSSDRLIYFFFFPTMLFWKIGAPGTEAAIDLRLSLAVLSAVFTVYVLSLLLVKVLHLSRFQVGAFSQCCYRFNTYIGMAIMLTAMGDEGVRAFAVLIGMVIPFINVLAVSTLIWFSSEGSRGKDRAGVLIKETLTNPLIIACFSGILFSKTGLSFPVFLDNTFYLLSMVALPMALISIGGSLGFARLKGRIKMATIATLFKQVLLPAVGFLYMKSSGVGDMSFQMGMVFFMLPTSMVSYILSAQLNSDADLASAAIVLSTLLSVISLSVALSLFVA